MANTKRPARKVGGQTLPGGGFPDLRRTLWRLLLLCLVTQPLHAFLPPKLPPELDAKLKALPRVSPPQPVVRGNRTYHGDRGSLRSWRPENVWVPAGDPRTMAETFLRRYARDLSLKPDLSDLTLVSVRQMDSAARVTFQQVYQDIPLDGVQVVVVVRLDGRILNVMSDYVPHLNVDLQGTPIGCDRAIQAVKDFWGLPVRIRSPYACRFQILVHPQPRPVYAVRFSPKGIGGRWLGMVDAFNGEILSVYQYSIPFQDATVYRPDPVSRAGVHYGSPGYADHGNQSTPELDYALETVQINPQMFGDSVFLENERVRILQNTPDDTQLVTMGYDASTTWIPRSDPHFEGVMAFYHLTNLWQRMNRSGYSPPKVLVFPNSPDTGAWTYLYDTPRIRQYAIELGGADPYASIVDAGEDAAIVGHEYFHVLELDVLSGGFCRGSSCSVESAAIGEAFADYWGGSYGVDELPWYGDTIGMWGLRPQWHGRALATFKRYPQDITTDPHTTGQILSGALWATFRSPDSSLSTDEIDLLIVNALFFGLWRNALLPDAAKAFMDVLKYQPDLWSLPTRGCAKLYHEMTRRNLLRPPEISWGSPLPDTVAGGSREWFWVGILDPDLVGWKIVGFARLSTGMFRPETSDVSGGVFVRLPDVAQPQQIPVWAVLYGPRWIPLDTIMTSVVVVPKPEIQILHPTEGEELTGGTEKTLRWQVMDPFHQVDSMRVLFSYDGTSWEETTGILPYTDTLIWEVPSNTFTENAQILLQLYNERHVDVAHKVSGLFRIAPPPRVQLHWPNGPGIKVVEGETYWIRYSAYTPEGVDSVTGCFPWMGAIPFPELFGVVDSFPPETRCATIFCSG